jgi:hypothetical protein
MDQDDLALLSADAQQEYMAYQRKFESEDWKETVEWAKSQAAVHAARQLAAQSWEQFMIAKGQRLSYMDIINLEDAIENEALSAVDEARERSIAAVEAENE